MGDYNDGILPEPCLRLEYEGNGDYWKSIELGDGTGYYRSDYFAGAFKTVLNMARVLNLLNIDLSRLVMPDIEENDMLELMKTFSEEVNETEDGK